MTAQIAIMNKHGLAIASDTASTAQSKKVFNSAQKMFRLSEHHPVGIMVYNVPEICFIPIELIIKSYRKHLGTTSFPSITDYVNDFLEFIKNENSLFNEEAEKKDVTATIYTFLKPIIKKIQDEFDKTKDSTDEEKREIAKKVLREVLIRWEKYEFLDSMYDEFTNRFKEKYSTTLLQKVIKSFFSEKLIDDELHKIILNISCLFFCKKRLEGKVYTGIVIGGFGENEYFPVTVHLVIQSRVLNILKYEQFDPRKITVDINASIVPYAQSDEIHSFISGMTYSYKQYITNYIKIVQRSIQSEMYKLDGIPKDFKDNYEKSVTDILIRNFTNFTNDISKYEKTKNSNTIIDAVRYVSCDDLAIMAETLIQLTSFRRKMSMDLETVGGNIQVATITKYEGFNWIKK